MLSRHPIGPDVSMIAQLPESERGRLVIGYNNSSIEVVDSNAPNTAPLTLRQTASGVPLRALAAPAGTVVVGFASGALGLWSIRTGERLAYTKLHGALIHMKLIESKLYAATDLGQYIVWDLGDLVRDRCELLRRVWKAVPVVWSEGRVKAAAPPSSHQCHNAPTQPAPN